MKKALVIQPAFIGDAVTSIALANALKSADPGMEITYLVRPESVGLLRYAPSISDVIAFDKHGAESGISGVRTKAEQLNERGFEVVFCLHTSRRSLELVKLLNAPVKVGIVASEVFTHVLRPEERDDATKKAARLATALYREANVDALQSLSLPDSLLPTGFSELPRPLIGIAPGSVWPTKRWPEERFISLMERYSSRSGSIVVLGQNGDIDIGLDDGLKALTHKAINYVSELSLESTAAVISKLDVLISNDSAPVHIAVATGTPVVTIMGPTVREFGFAPRAGSGLVVENAALWCRPCSSHGSIECPVHSFECMRGISVDMVTVAVDSLL